MLKTRMNNWDDIAYIVRSKYRKNAFLNLDQATRPSQIAKKLNIRLTHVSRALKELEKGGYVECLNPADKFGRLYRLSEKGLSLNGSIKTIK